MQGEQDRTLVRRTVPFEEGEILLEEGSPPLPEREAAERRGEIEARLFAVFSRYRRAADET